MNVVERAKLLSDLAASHRQLVQSTHAMVSEAVVELVCQTTGERLCALGWPVEMHAIPRRPTLTLDYAQIPLLSQHLDAVLVERVSCWPE